MSDSGPVLAEFEFCLLGPLTARRSGAPFTVPPGKQRVILAMLLLNPGRVVRLDELAEALWADGPPPSGPVAVQNYVMRLRKSLGEAGRDRIITQAPGYLIRIADSELDVSRFEALLRAARAAARDCSWDQVALHSRGALALWRGEPLADVDCEPLAAREAPRLAELRLQALEIRIEADLHLGRHAEVIAELRQLTSEHPLRERLHAALMLALYRDGRQAEALVGYADARQVLVTELGTEPGAVLRDLHHQILTADPALDMPAPTLPAGGNPPSVPRELPASVRNFTGRSDELRTLTRLLDRPDDKAPGTVVISAIDGTAGVGKTALAVHWAHQVADRFPDGQLYVNLRGYDPGQPMDATEALAGFLRALGMPGQDIPAEAEERAARYRSLLSGRRVLVVLDNVSDAEQVRPLLPGTGACTVVVTSRDTLAGLVARDGAARLDLDVLPLPDAVALLRTLIGARADAEPAATAELAGQCCRLPLALRVAAELAASRPAEPLAGLTGELADLRTRLKMLETGGDPRADVRAVFSWSLRHLDTDAAAAFRLLGLHPGPDFESYAAAALTGTTVPQARRALEVLARAHLIQVAAPGRYGMHDLLRGYARELAGTQDSEEARRAALTRLFDHYLCSAGAAMDTLFPAERHRRPRVPQPDTTPAPPLPDLATAREWLDGERAALVATGVYTGAHGWPRHATHLAATLSRYFYSGDHFAEAITVFNHALDAARRTGDRLAEATALNHLGEVDLQQSRLQQAGDRCRQALALFRAAGDRAGEAQALTNVGLADKTLGRYDQAGCYLREAVVIYRLIGDRFGEARTLGNLGVLRRLQGRYQEAAGYHQQTLDLFRQIGDRLGEAWALTRLGRVDLQLGRHQHAARNLEEAVALMHELGDKGEFEVLVILGEVYLLLGHYEQAAGNFERTLAVSREVGDPDLEASALNGLGEILFRTGDAGKARAHHASALQLAAESGSPRKQAQAHSGLARVCQVEGDQLQARHHWQEALTRYEAIGAPEADEIRAELGRIDDSADATTGYEDAGWEKNQCRSDIGL